MILRAANNNNNCSNLNNQQLPTNTQQFKNTINKLLYKTAEQNALQQALQVLDLGAETDYKVTLF